MLYVSVLTWLSQRLLREIDKHKDASILEPVETSQPEVSDNLKARKPSLDELSYTSEHRCFDEIRSSYVEPPSTPEGLKPRRCLETVCEELGIDTRLAFDLHKANSNSSDRCHNSVFDKFIELNASSTADIGDRPYEALPLWLSQSESWGSNFVSSQDPRSLDEYYRLHHASSNSQQRSYYHDVAVRKATSWDTNHPQTAVGATVVAIENPFPHRNFLPVDNTFLYRESTQGTSQLEGLCRNADRHGGEESCSIEASPSSRVCYPRSKGDNKIQTSFTSASNTIRISHAMSSEENKFLQYVTTDAGGANRPAEAQCQILKERTNGNQFAIATIDQESKNFKLQHEENGLDNRLRNLKTTAQRRALDALVFSIIERLKDDKELVSQIKVFPATALAVPSVIQVENESILKGFSSRSRLRLIMILDTSLKEMYKGISVDEYFLSGSRTEQLDEMENIDRRLDLIDALMFCKGIVNMSVLDHEISAVTSITSEEGRWKFISELRSLIGISPNSPSNPCGRRSRGDDISYCSLPFNAGTPMTSNVSVATTLTSTFDKRGSQRFASVDGLQLRFVLSTFLTIVESLSVQLNTILSVESRNVVVASGAIRRIKDDYLQICKLDRHSLRNIVEGFEIKYKRESPEKFGIPQKESGMVGSRTSSNNSTISSNKSTVSRKSVNPINENSTIKTVSSRRDRHTLRRGNRFSLKRFL